MSISKNFPILKTKINGHDLVYLDNASTCQKPQVMIEALSEFYTKHNANIHRSSNPLADIATKKYEDSRLAVAQFLNCQKNEIIFTRNTTESINLVAKTFAKTFLQAGDVVLLSLAEHHSNIVPWLQLKQEIGIELAYLPLDKNGYLDIVQAKIMLTDKVKFVSIQAASNVLGSIHDYREILKLAKVKNITTLLDAAQIVAHESLNVQELACDFLVFSAHKMFGPTGVGVLYGRKDLLQMMPAFLGGGEMINQVLTDTFTPNELPYKFEAGTPNIADVVAFKSSLDFIKNLTWEYIQKTEQELTDYLWQEMLKLDFVDIYGKNIANKHLPIISFNLKNAHAHDVAELLGEQAIIVRAGQHCTQILHESLGVPATVRASLTFYNTKKEIDLLIKNLRLIYNKFKV
ncbi:MAG: Cysteine desulfurase [Parcubacteria group bacterium GW2011_GWA2_36_10]|nr:MAG: Cysteine desulfurase [Parcubacteria group bacterium GW2011_GWA2_36_10]